MGLMKPKNLFDKYGLDKSVYPDAVKELQKREINIKPPTMF